MVRLVRKDSKDRKANLVTREEMENQEPPEQRVLQDNREIPAPVVAEDRQARLAYLDKRAREEWEVSKDSPELLDVRALLARKVSHCH